MEWCSPPPIFSHLIPFTTPFHELFQKAIFNTLWLNANQLTYTPLPTKTSLSPLQTSRTLNEILSHTPLPTKTSLTLQNLTNFLMRSNPMAIFALYHELSRKQYLIISCLKTNQINLTLLLFHYHELFWKAIFITLWLKTNQKNEL